MFKCSPTGRGECQLIPFDTSGNKFAANGQQYDAKSGQWFGATVTSAGDDKLVLVICLTKCVQSDILRLPRKPKYDCIYLFSLLL